MQKCGRKQKRRKDCGCASNQRKICDLTPKILHPKPVILNPISSGTPCFSKIHDKKRSCSSWVARSRSESTSQFTALALNKPSPPPPPPPPPNNKNHIRTLLCGALSPQFPCNVASAGIQPASLFQKRPAVSIKETNSADFRTPCQHSFCDTL